MNVVVALPSNISQGNGLVRIRRWSNAGNSIFKMKKVKSGTLGRYSFSRKRNGFKYWPGYVINMCVNRKGHCLNPGASDSPSIKDAFQIVV